MTKSGSASDIGSRIKRHCRTRRRLIRIKNFFYDPGSRSAPLPLQGPIERQAVLALRSGRRLVCPNAISGRHRFHVPTPA